MQPFSMVHSCVCVKFLFAFIWLMRLVVECVCAYICLCACVSFCACVVFVCSCASKSLEFIFCSLTFVHINRTLVYFLIPTLASATHTSRGCMQIIPRRLFCKILPISMPQYKQLKTAMVMHTRVVVFAHCESNLLNG